MSISAIEYLRHIRDETRFLATAVDGVGLSRFMVSCLSVNVRKVGWS